MTVNVLRAAGVTVALFVGLGVYGLVTNRNLFKVLVSLNVLSKAVTLTIASATALRHDYAFGQGFMIAVMLADVVVTAVVLSILVNAYRHTGSLDVQDLGSGQGKKACQAGGAGDH